jgi:hypothetical protein
VTLRAGALTVSQTLRPSDLEIVVTEGVDTVRVAAALDGRVRLARGGRTRAFSMARVTRDDAAAARELLGASPALRAFEALIASPWGQSRAALPFAAPQALLALLQSRTEPVRAYAERIQRSSGPAIVTARTGPNECWYTYQRDVVRLTYDFEQCMVESAGTLDFTRTIWCAYSYNFRATIAFTWLLNCSGGS